MNIKRCGEKQRQEGLLIRLCQAKDVRSEAWSALIRDKGWQRCLVLLTRRCFCISHWLTVCHVSRKNARKQVSKQGILKDYEL